jgi:N-acetylglucosaminyl-diphospho-decaprenol L-rhamnosyltransferase
MGCGSVSILLVSWNAASVIERCLRSIDVATCEVVVVDNASDDDSAKIVAELFPAVRLLRQSTNLGFAGGVNAGLHACTGSLVLLLNCDTVAHEGSIARLEYALRTRPDSAAAGGALFDERGIPQHGFHVRRFPTLWTWLVDLWLVDKLWPSNPVTRRYLALDQTSGARGMVEVDQPAAACLMLRREALKQIGGMDEGFYPAWFEDVDLCRRLKDAGWRIVFVPDAAFTHVGGPAMRRLGLAGFSRVWYRNLQRYVRKHDGVLALLACKGLIVSGMALRVVISLIRFRWSDARAYTDVAIEALQLKKLEVRT